MTILNKPLCGESGGNTGVCDCFFDPKKIVRAFLVPTSFRLTAAQLASTALAIAALTAAASADLPANRIYPLPEIEGVTANDEATVFATLGYGTQYPVRDGYYNAQFQFLKGGLSVLTKLQSHNGTGKAAFLLDSDGYLIGTRAEDGGMKGAPLAYFFAPKWGMSDGTNPSQYFYGMGMKPEYINKNIAFIKLDSFEVENIEGLKDLSLSLSVARAAGVIRVGVTTDCGDNMYDQYSAQLADPDNFVVTRNGAVVNITSVAAVANTKDFTITLDTTDPDYNVAGPFYVSLAAPSVLAGNNIDGFAGEAKLYVP